MEFDKCWLVELAFIDHKRDPRGHAQRRQHATACAKRWRRCITS